MVPMFVIGGVVAFACVAALVLAQVADRRRAISVGSDPTRFAPPAVEPRLPWL